MRLHERKIDTPEYYEKVWAAEYNTRPYYDTYRQLALAGRVKSGDLVVDLGAGCFGTAQFIAEKLNHLECDLVAVDYSPTAMALISERLKGNKRFEYLLSEAERTPLSPGSFDCVVAGELIEHYEDPHELVCEMVRLCKPGGWITLSTVDTSCEDAIRHGEYPEHIWEFSADELVGFFAPFGSTAYRLVGDYHFIECQRS